MLHWKSRKVTVAALVRALAIVRVLVSLPLVFGVGSRYVGLAAPCCNEI